MDYAPEKVHASCEGYNICKSNNALTLEEFAGHHGVWSKLPLPDDPRSNKAETEQQRAQDIGAAPRVGVAARIQCDKAVENQH